MKSQKLIVSDREIIIKRINDQDYISLTNMVADDQRASIVIQNWLRNKNTLEFLGIWERLYNPDFKGIEFDAFYNQAGLNRFTISPKEWIEKTQSIGIMSKSGRYGGTYAHRDIAFEFGAHISAEFKLYLVSDYIRLKEQEYDRQRLTWDYQRFLSKVNYRLHTDTIRDHMLPDLATQKGQEWLVYADEADLLNMAVFGQTAKQWRDKNPDLAKKGNMRDHADMIQLNVLANLESLNAVMIEEGTAKEKRFKLLAKTAASQYKRLERTSQLDRLK